MSVDAIFNGDAFRFIGTHLESIDADVRQHQGGELRAGPANTPLPVNVVGHDAQVAAALRKRLRGCVRQHKHPGNPGEQPDRETTTGDTCDLPKDLRLELDHRGAPSCLSHCRSL